MHQPETIIEGNPDVSVITRAVNSYFSGLLHLAYPNSLGQILKISDQEAETLKKLFSNRLKEIAPTVIKIITEINHRSRILVSDDFKKLLQIDKNCYVVEKDVPTLFGILACVDKGIPSEAVIGVDGAMGRTLAGDIGFYYSPAKKQFVASASAITKRFIHAGRQGVKLIIELLIEHIGCGRRGQMLANDAIRGDIPSMGYVIERLQALSEEFTAEDINKIQEFWNKLPRQGSAVIVKDGGVWAGILTKMCQRQALLDLKEHINLHCPIEIYDKRNGDLLVGVDRVEILTDKKVLQETGFTQKALDFLIKQRRIFSLTSYNKEIFPLIEKISKIKKGAKTYQALQTDWLECQKLLIQITANLWSMYRNKNPEFKIVRKMAADYFTRVDPLKKANLRLLHHLFHVLAYMYLFNTLEKGNSPGVVHIEDHLATGDHSLGAKVHLALGQGDLERPQAPEMFTGYSVLLHSIPGTKGNPMPVMIKLDTERSGQEAMTTEETNVAINDFAEFLKLWPYFLVGDMIPVLAIRGKKIGGISRLGLSVILSFGDMINLYDDPSSILPRFVPANNEKSEVVYVPTIAVIKTGLKTTDLKSFRKEMINVANLYSQQEVQNSFKLALNKR